MPDIYDLFNAMDEKYASANVGYITYGNLTGHAEEFTIESRLDGMDEQDDDIEDYDVLVLSVVLSEDNTWVSVLSVDTWSPSEEGVSNKVKFEISRETTHKALCDWFDSLDRETDKQQQQRAYMLLQIYLQCALDPLWDEFEPTEDIA